MSINIRLVRGDTHPSLMFQIRDRATGKPISLEPEAMIPMAKFREAGTAATLFTATLAKVPGAEHIGQARLDWPAGALDVPEGIYEIEVYVTLGNSQVQTCYNVIRAKVREDFA